MFHFLTRPPRLLLFGLLVSSVLPSHALDEPETLGLLIDTVLQCDQDSTRLALLTGTLRGLEGRRDVGAPAGWADLQKQIRDGESESLQRVANQLSQIFGDEESARLAMQMLKDESVSLQKRREALRSLVSQRDPKLADVLPSLLQQPAMRLDTIRAFGVISNDQAAELLLKHYAQANELERRAIIETMATRKTYASDLITALKSGVVLKEHIPSYTARSLRDLLGKSFTDAYGEIPELKTDTAALIAKYKSKLTPDAIAKANAGRGRAVFQKTCGACHLMYGIGGKIGPDLTGSNRANLDYLLLNSIDPSGDVPEGYRTVLIQTVDGRVLTGVLAEEDSQRVVLKTVDQPRLVIAKADIEARKVSEKSMMPEGQLDQLSTKQLLDLVKYMQTKTQVEAVQ